MGLANSPAIGACSTQPACGYQIVQAVSITSNTSTLLRVTRPTQGRRGGCAVGSADTRSIMSPLPPHPVQLPTWARRAARHEVQVMCS